MGRDSNEMNVYERGQENLWIRANEDERTTKLQSTGEGDKE